MTVKSLNETQKREIVIQYEGGTSIIGLAFTFDRSTRTIERVLDEYEVGRPRRVFKPKSPKPAPKDWVQLFANPEPPKPEPQTVNPTNWLFARVHSFFTTKNNATSQNK